MAIELLVSRAQPANTQKPYQEASRSPCASATLIALQGERSLTSLFVLPTNRDWAAKVIKRVASLSPAVPDRMPRCTAAHGSARSICVDVRADCESRRRVQHQRSCAGAYHDLEPAVGEGRLDVSGNAVPRVVESVGVAAFRRSRLSRRRTQGLAMVRHTVLHDRRSDARGARRPRLAVRAVSVQLEHAYPSVAAVPRDHESHWKTTSRARSRGAKPSNEASPI